MLELRLQRARTTRDVDLRLTGGSDDLLVEFQRAGRLDAGDYLTFVVTPDREHPTIAEEDDLRWRTLAELVAAVRAFLDPVLMGAVGTWSPETWSW